MVLGSRARRRRVPNPGVADLGEVCVADPEMGAVTGNDLRESAALLRNESWGDDSEYAVLADRLEAWADDMEAERTRAAVDADLRRTGRLERLALLEAVVLDALSVEDLRAAAIVAAPHRRGAELSARLDAAADALAALREAQQ
jgi:hypothetical protein